jgi:hypothetical protein
MAYCGLCAAIFSNVDGYYGSLIIGVSYAVGITCSFLLLPTFILTVIFFIVNIINKNKA